MWSTWLSNIGHESEKINGAVSAPTTPSFCTPISSAQHLAECREDENDAGSVVDFLGRSYNRRADSLYDNAAGE